MPEYPSTAANVGGHVALRFTIGANGHTQNPEIIQSDPPGLFDQAALAAVSRWLYYPRTLNGRAVSQPNNAVNLTFQPPALEPTFKPSLSFPRQAYAAHQEGSVTIAFDIAPTGLTTNLRVVKSDPPGVFDKNALAYVSDWQYAAPTGDKPILNQTTEVAFTLANAELSPIPLHAHTLNYPFEALSDQVMGDCNVGFWIEENGATTGVQILSCTPSGYFEAATLDFVKKTTYQVEAEPRLNHRRYHRLSIKFRFNGSSDSEIAYLKPGQWIKLRYTRSIDGHAKNIEVIAQSSPNLPTYKAVEQLRHTSFAAVTENGHSIEKPNFTVVISARPN